MSSTIYDCSIAHNRALLDYCFPIVNAKLNAIEESKFLFETFQKDSTHGSLMKMNVNQN